MSAESIYEVIGYVGSALVVVSLAMSSIIRLRVINLAGALVFTAYGALIGSIPVLLTNLAIAGIDVWHLWKELSTREELTVIAVARDDPFLSEFVEMHRSDLDGFVDLDGAIAVADTHLVMVRNANLAGVFLGRVGSAASMEVLVDYVAPPYRDLKSGVCLYADGGARFRGMGMQSMFVQAPDRRQTDYFEAMGFVGATGGRLVKELTGGPDGV